MKETITYRTKLTQVKGDLKATVIAKHLPSGLAVVSRPMNSEAEAKAEARAQLARNLRYEGNAPTELQTENRSDTHVVKSL